MWARCFSNARRPAGVRRYSVRGRRLDAFLDGDVLRVLELACVNAEVAVGRVQQALEIAERQAFVNQAIEAERAGLGARDSRLGTREHEYRSQRSIRLGVACPVCS
jgi:hypothetical protein